MEIAFNIFGWMFIALYFYGLCLPFIIVKHWIKELDKLIQNGNKWPTPDTTTEE